MELKEFWVQMETCNIDVLKVQKIENAYKVSLPDLAKKLISYVSEPIFIGNFRMLSFIEVLESEDELYVPFSKEGLIPFVDCMDNDFIVYDFVNKVWTKYNIVDQCKFGKQGELESLMK